MVTRSTSGAMSAKGGSCQCRGGIDLRRRSMSQFRVGPSRFWDFPGISWDKRVKGDLAHFHRPCLSDKRNLACSTISRSLGFGSSDCSISQLSDLNPVLCLDYLSVMFNRSIVYSPFDSSPKR